MFFTLLTALIHSIDSDRQKVELERQKHEFKVSQEKEVLHRFLNSFEQIIHSLYRMKTYLTISILDKQKNIETDILLKYYEEILSLKVLSRTYINNDEIPQEIDNFMSNLYILIELSSQKDQDKIQTKIKEVQQAIDPLIKGIQNAIKKQINNG